MIRFGCECGRPLQAAENAVGRPVVCPACGRSTLVPGGDSFTAAGSGRIRAGEPRRWQDPEAKGFGRGKLIGAVVVGAVGVAVLAVVVLLATGWPRWGKPSEISGTFPRFSVEELTAALEDEDSDIRYSAAVDLSLQGKKAAPAVAALTKLLADPDKPTRLAAVEALGKIGEDSAPAAGALAGLLTNPASSADVRLAAAVALGSIGPKAESAAAALAQAQKEDGDEEVRRNSTIALTRLGPEAAKRAGRRPPG